ncbi:MAG: tryptophan synthase subunit alpha [Acidobacteria bacterium]|nr:tryptophan synthase subunit alpha [Acidobacteriota bacterium]
MNRYQQMFDQLKSQGRGAFVPFTVLGDPSPDDSLNVVQALIDGGADALELGIPFSDPIADGPVIQASAQRALRAGTTPEICWSLLARIRARNQHIPIGLLTYANLAAGTGIESFYLRAADAGVDSILMADVPSLEAGPYVRAARTAGIDPVMIAPINATHQQLDIIAELGSGYTYVVTRFGVTGARQSIELRHTDLLHALRHRNAAPSLMGFGISNPNAVKMAIASGASGAISGSAIVAQLDPWLGESTLTALRAFTQSMVEAT